MYLGSSGEWKMDKACCQGNLWPAEVSLSCAILSKVLSDHTRAMTLKVIAGLRTPRNAGAVTVPTQWQLRQVTPKRSQYNRQNWTPLRTVWVAALKARIQEEGWSQLPPAASDIHIHVHIFIHVDILLCAYAHGYCCV